MTETERPDQPDSEQMAMPNGTVTYAVDGAVARVTMARPEVANALDAAMINDLDSALVLAEADPGVRVIILSGQGKHFCSGHDLSELMAGEEHWAAMRDTPEGKLEHETTMYLEPCLRWRNTDKITIAAVQGACAAAGLMLACMCDLIVASEDARFSNPVLRMSGAGVELLVEPWELGARRAKEFLLCARKLSAAEAEQAGMVNRVVPGDDLSTAAHAMAAEVALVPPVTAAAVKGTINFTLDRAGQSDSWQHHFMVHQFVSATDTATSLADKRSAGGMDGVKREQGS
ncbi:MAG: enoyl-CoA hydratase [Microthrixaceae bacterium]